MGEPSQPEQLHVAMSAFKRDLIRRTLLRYGGNRSRAAAALGIDRTSLLRLLRELDREGMPPAQNGRPTAARNLRRRAGPARAGSAEPKQDLL